MGYTLVPLAVLVLVEPAEAVEAQVVPEVVVLLTI